MGQQGTRFFPFLTFVSFLVFLYVVRSFTSVFFFFELRSDGQSVEEHIALRLGDLVYLFYLFDC